MDKGRADGNPPPPSPLPELKALKWVSRRQKGVFEIGFPVNIRVASSTDSDISILYEFYTVSKSWLCSSFCFPHPLVLSRRPVHCLAGEAWMESKFKADEGVVNHKQNPKSVAPETDFITMPTPSAVKIGNKRLVRRSQHSSWVLITYHRVPRPSAQAHAIIAHTQTTDSVFVAVQAADPVTSKYIPNLNLSGLARGETFGEPLDSMERFEDGVLSGKRLTLHSKSS